MTTASFLFILVGTLSVCEFAMVPGVYPSGVYCVFREKRFTVIPTHSAAQPSKRFKLLSVSILLWQGHCWIGTTKTTKKKQQKRQTVHSACNLTK